mmetsp:Transcript_1432/g.8804  ORF Transcript_1432/g.8804 Transcript_1432/m.8804 type:complete len:225 (-) Transcript_1432:535-1209(-)
MGRWTRPKAVKKNHAGCLCHWDKLEPAVRCWWDSGHQDRMESVELHPTCRNHNQANAQSSSEDETRPAQKANLRCWDSIPTDAAGTLPCNCSKDPSRSPPKPSVGCILSLRTPSPAIGTAAPGSPPATVPLPLPVLSSTLFSLHGSSAPLPGSSSSPWGFLGCHLALPSQNSSEHSWTVPEPFCPVASRWPTGAPERGSASILRERTTSHGVVSPKPQAFLVSS